MKLSSLSQSFCNAATVASVIAASTLTIGTLAPSASAVSLVPQQEGEINVGFQNSLSGDDYLTLDPVIESIESIEDSSTGTKSRLFVDKAGTENIYGSLVKFLKFDIGTADRQESYWFRPVAMKNSTTPLVEKGQLEVGTFKFTFKETIDKLTLSWFDTEYVGGGTSYVVGSESGYVPAGKNNNIYSQTFTNVSSLLLNLGQAGSGTLVNGNKVNWKGDGVLVTAEAETVPEPATVGALLGLGALGLIKRRKGAVS